MREETLYQNGRRIATIYHPAVPAWTCPTVVGEEQRDGVRFYVDNTGGRHVAETFDKVWGKSDAKAILPKSKRQFQRIRKM